jgi:hypothetical protein
MDEELRAELLARRDEDQRIRHAAMQAADKTTGRLPDDLGAEWRRVDTANTEWLNDLVDTSGWPGRSLVGKDGAKAAWLLAQHADQGRDLQRKFLDLLRAAVAAGEAEARDLAYLEDRVRVADGRPQLYGTQFQGRGEDLAPCPIEDPGRLDERRIAAGLQPFAEYEATLRARYGASAS